jgi:hypothetical protein
VTDILTRLAALTAKEDIERIARDFAERFGMPHKAGKGFRLCHEDDMTKGITGAIYASNAALIALVQDAAREIESLKEWQTVALAIGEREKERLKERELHEQEAAHG